MNKFSNFLILLFFFFVVQQNWAQEIAQINSGVPINNCAIPRNVKASLFNYQTIKIEWSGDAATPRGLHYAIRYRKNNTTPWVQEETNVGKSFMIHNIDFTQPYDIEIGTICSGNNFATNWQSAPYRDYQTPDKKERSSGIDLCREGKSECDSILLNRSLQNGDFIFLDGIKILVEDLTASFAVCEGKDKLGYDVNFLDTVWNGTGTAFLPIIQAPVSVELKNIKKIDRNMKVCPNIDASCTNNTITNPEAKGIRDVPPNLPELDPQHSPYTKTFCKPKPSCFDKNGIHCQTGKPWDPYGFDKDGKYKKQPPYNGYPISGINIDTSGKYDANGFDKNGIHKDTKTKFGPNGCGRDSLDIDGHRCDPTTNPPFAWLNNQVISLNALQYADSLANFIDFRKLFIDQQILYNGLHKGKKDSCENNMRRPMMALATQLGYSTKDYLFGKSDEYIKEGMSKQFSSVPTILSKKVSGRSDKQSDLEELHVSLYYCDKKQLYYEEYSDIIANILLGLGTTTEPIKTIIHGQIKSLPIDTIQKFRKDPIALMRWLKRAAQNYTISVHIERFGYADVAPTIDIEEFELTKNKKPLILSPDLMWADNGENPLNLKWNTADAARFRSFQFLQEYENVEGVDRSFYVEYLAKQNRVAHLERKRERTAINPTLMPIILGNYSPQSGRANEVYADNLCISEGKSKMDLYYILEANGERVPFKAIGIPLSATDSFYTRLELAGEVEFPINNVALIKLNKGGNFVAIDCHGFAGIGIDAEIKICREYVIPIRSFPPYDTLPSPAMVNAKFKLFAPHWDEIFAKLTITPFVVKGFESVKWITGSAYVDFSDQISPNGGPPNGYVGLVTHNGNQFTFDNEWRGFYMDSLRVVLPDNFKRKGSNDPITVGVRNVVIDDTGFSGSIFVTNLLSLGDGSAGGWAFSADSFFVDIVQGDLMRGGFGGLINIPLFKGKSSKNKAPDAEPERSDCFSYVASLARGGIFTFAVSPADSIFTIPMWKAGRVNMFKNTHVEMVMAKDSFNIIANLSGKFEVNDTVMGKLPLKLPDVEFHNLVISNRKPYIREVGNWKIPGGLGVDYAGFKLGIDSLLMTKKDNEPALYMKIHVGIADTMLNATGSFFLLGEVRDVNGRQRWKYKKAIIECLNVDGSFGSVEKISASLCFFRNDNVYGTGFRGAAAVKLRGLKMVGGVAAAAQFGNIDNVPNPYKYFFIDLAACTKIQIFTGLDLRAIGGGVFYHMKRDTGDFKFSDICEKLVVPTGVGLSLSGIKYVPDISTHIIVKAMVGIATTGSDSAFNTAGSFEIAIEKDGHLKNIFIDGSAKFMAPFEMATLPPIVKATTTLKPPSGNTAALNAYLSFKYDFDNKTMKGHFDTYLNVADALVGRQQNGFMGRAEVYSDTSQWFFKIGKPWSRDPLKADERFGAVLKLPTTNGPPKTLAELSLYLQIGSAIDPMPPLPEKVRKLTGATDMTQRNRLKNGAGFAFGAELNMGADVEFLNFLYAGIKADMGFDLAMMDYGPTAICAETQQRVGINGWYASGQMYAMLEAKVGVIMDGGAKVPLINIEAGAVLQGRLPNPFWGEGAFGVNIRALGGIIKYKGNFQMTLGQPCTIVGKSASTSVPNVQLISELSPYHETSEVSVEINPTVIFAAPMDKPITATSNDGSVTKTYTVKLDTVELRSYVGVLIPAELIWADATNKTKLKLKPYYFLPPNDSVTLLVSASYTDNQGVITRERKVSKFVTSDAPMFIPTSNVRGAYPMDGQYNLYREEYQVMVEGVKQSRGNISLHKGQPYLLENPDYEIQVQFTQSGSLNKIMTKADYKESEEELSYELPNTLLKNTLYKQEVLAKSTIGKPNLVLYTTYFRVSKYKDFTTKMKFFANNLLTVSPEESFVVSVEHDVMDEPFDAYELGVTGTGLPKTVDLDADFTKWKWLYHEAGFPYAMYEYWNKVAPKLGYASIAFPDDYVVNLAQTDSKNNSYPAPLLNMKDNQKVYISADDWKNGKSGIPDKYRISVNVGLPNIMKFDAVTIANSIKSAIINNKCDGFDTNTLNSSSCPLFANNWNIGLGNLIEFFGTGGMSGFKGKNTNSEAVKGKGFEPPQKDDEFPVWLRYRLPSKEKSSADQLIEIIAN